jgi:hypothetical protein
MDPFAFSPGMVYECGSRHGLKSLKAGAACQTYMDCPSNVNGTYARCECPYTPSSTSGSPICGILFENAEYTDYISAAKDLNKATSHCHNARSILPSSSGDG